MARWEEQLTWLVVLKKWSTETRDKAPEDYQRQIFQELKELEEQQTRESLQLLQRKHKLIKYEGEWERAKMLQMLESSRAVGPRQFFFWFLLIVLGL